MVVKHDQRRISNFESPDQKKPQHNFIKFDGFNTALHKAKLNEDNRSIEILLSFMSKIPKNCSKTFSDIMPTMIEYKSFKMYLDQLCTQSHQMMSKQVLRKANPFSSDIIALAHGSTQYIDETFYEKKMGESQDNTVSSFPVKIVCLRVGWILYDSVNKKMSKQGHKLLQNILWTDELEFFTILPLKILIEFLYMKIKTYLI